VFFGKKHSVVFSKLSAWLPRKGFFFWKRTIRAATSRQGQHLTSQIAVQFSKLKKFVNVKVIPFNYYAYLLIQKIINKSNYQDHFWDPRYKWNRFRWSGYFDYTSAVMVLGLLREINFLLSLMEEALPNVYRIKKYFYFIDLMLKSSKYVKNRFKCIRISLNGKSKGKTRRTSSLTIGKGWFARQTLQSNIKQYFFPYTHLWGEFGVSLLLLENNSNRRI